VLVTMSLVGASGRVPSNAGEEDGAGGSCVCTRAIQRMPITHVSMSAAPSATDAIALPPTRLPALVPAFMAKAVVEAE
jgi:hypothetical protein